MPVVTALDPAPGRLGGFRVELGDVSFRVPDDLVQRESLRLGSHLSAERAADLMAEAGRREAMDRAVHYLSYRPRTRMEVRRYLRGHGLSTSADHAIERCVELGYLDDRGYAEAFVRERIRLRPRGRPRLVSELLARGIDRHTAERAVTETLAEEGLSEQALLRDVAVRRVAALRNLEPDTARRRLSSYLARRGFRTGDIREVVGELLPADDGRRDV